MAIGLDSTTDWQPGPMTILYLGLRSVLLSLQRNAISNSSPLARVRNACTCMLLLGDSSWEEMIEHPGLSHCDMPLSNLLQVNSCRSLMSMRIFAGQNLSLTADLGWHC